MFDFIWVALLWCFAAAEMRPNITMESSALTAEEKANLTCTVTSLHSASDVNITWTWICAGGKDSCIEGNITEVKTENLTGGAQRHSSTLNFIASAEQHLARVTCNVSLSNGATAQKNKTLTVLKNPTSSDTSVCELKSDVLTCECIGRGFPSPTIKWHLIENFRDFSVLTIVLNNTVKSTITMSVKRQSNTTFECVSSNGQDEQGQSHTNTEVQQEDLFSELLRTIKKVEVIIAFFIGFPLGILFTSCITCLARKCRRQKLEPGRVMEDLEMVNTLTVQKYVGHAAEEVGLCEQEEVGGEPAGSSAPEGDVRRKDVEYSHIDFSMMKTKNPAEEELTKESTDTEYAEIKKERREDGEGNEGEGMEEIEEMRKDEENEDGIPAEEEGEEGAGLYSNVKEIMDEV